MAISQHPDSQYKSQSFIHHLESPPSRRSYFRVGVYNQLVINRGYGRYIGIHSEWHAANQAFTHPHPAKRQRPPPYIKSEMISSETKKRDSGILIRSPEISKDPLSKSLSITDAGQCPSKYPLSTPSAVLSPSIIVSSTT
jgi:hypothetical protein